MWNDILLRVCLGSVVCVSSAWASYPESRECQPEQEQNCAGLAEQKSDLRVCDDSTCRYGGVCQENGGQLKCVCQFQCPSSFDPVCGSNGDTYQSECYLQQASCTQQTPITLITQGPCLTDEGSGSGDQEFESSGDDPSSRSSKCSSCRYGADCDEDSEDVWCVCNIDCSGHHENEVCGSDGRSYSNPCVLREASCMKQEQIDIKHLGTCTGRREEGGSFKPDLAGLGVAVADVQSDTQCEEHHREVCVHGTCEMKNNTAVCRCEAGFWGVRCEDVSVLYVVPDGRRLHYVLIASIIAATQITVICAVIMCIAWKCPDRRRGRRGQKQNLGHFPPDNHRGL
ncbi:tomoregulin-1 [Alosa pseudoharengus]|uniref:tomoregulin-1 n=1 Tax=Alosa pseudoharengus TaxID=34774 RepID=UPI003F89502B